ncbi:MAG TPA: hypothetical protein VKS82_26235 [Streptosporangiaceae bacterium]|nr:hypothetical protein [Streptosporangiaceae bacterium]
MRWTSLRLWVVPGLTASALGLLGAASAPASASALPGAVATAKPLLAEDQFSAVACPAVTGCLAVGQTAGGSEGAAAASWDGSAWHAQPPAVPPNAIPSTTDLLGESCPTAGRCVAVGKYVLNSTGTNVLTLAELWTGSGWQQLDTRYPSSDDHLGGVSCWAASDCIAVGGDRGFGGSHLPLAESWSGGPWVTMTTPSLGATDYGTMFNSVSCTSANWCMAVGVYDNTSHDTFTLAETWNGKQWTKVTAPGTGLSSVSCTSPSSCLAVSSSTVQRWNGTAWSVILTVTPPPGAPGFSDVTCLPATGCLLTGGNGTVPLAETWNGGTFRQQPVPSPEPGAQLNGAACTSAAHCVAVGQNSAGTTSVPYSMAAYWDGTSWRASRMGHLDGLGSVSCYQSGGCLATGSFLDPGDVQVPLAERVHRGTWQQVKPAPPSAGLTGLSSVSCASVSDCMAVNGAVGDLWNGKTWQITSLPIGAVSVACAATACLAAGGHSAALWNGTSWKALSPLKPKHSNATLFSSVSCPGRHWCMAVGQYFIDPHDSYGINLVEVWNGTSWQRLKLPGPGQNNGLNSVACTSVGHCMVAGSYNSSTSTYYSYADLWNGTSWRTFKLAGPDRFLVSVSCPAATHCQAAGYYSTLTGYPPVYRPVAESWNGGSWHKVPVGIGAGLFGSISCTQPDACVAVGQRDDGQVLAARWNGSKWSAMPAANP